MNACMEEEVGKEEEDAVFWLAGSRGRSSWIV